jgi:8-amino-7-oxononanoate synthase
LSLDWLNAALSDWEAQGLRRHLVTRTSLQAAQIEINGRTLINLGSNDYLSLASDPRLITAALQTTTLQGWGAGASPLITGHSLAHAELEETLANWLQTEAALVFPSGFAANAGTIAALVGEGDMIFSDAKNHASLIDGCRLSKAQIQIFPHLDYVSLAQQLQKTAVHSGRRLIVTDSLFSMDGDTADLPLLCQLSKQHQTMLLIDEAHATGVYGQQGTGLVEECVCARPDLIRIGTLSKAIGSAGGFVAGSQVLIDWLLNRARPYVFSTAHPPAVAAAATAAIQIIQSEPARGTELHRSAADLRTALTAQGWHVLPGNSQIIPIFIGDAQRTMQLHQALLERGIFVPGIRPPSVPAGEALLRLSLTYGHTGELLQQIVQHFAALRSSQG